MIYDILANYYDELVGDEIACQKWVEFTKKFARGSKLLDLACGSGDVTIALSKEGFTVRGIDFSKEMIAKAKSKDQAQRVIFEIGDMKELHDHHVYDVVTCYCDSINYLIHEEDVKHVFQSVYESLNHYGVFLFDVHTLDRLDEFKDEYLEEDYLSDVGYVWSIQSDENRLYQNFIFYTQDRIQVSEQHIQTVYHPKRLQELLENCGFQVEIWTDFDQLGIMPGEKYFFVARKE